MAVEMETTGNDMPAHVDSYVRFLKWLKFGAIASFGIGFIVVLLISR
ncbi:MAG: hypothetical protein H0X36_05805 [Sphingomonadaceae bacterium]|nr:hypothetical protein [Sphingomonadaceae bacterium]